MNDVQMQYAEEALGLIQGFAMPKTMGKQRTNAELTALVNGTHCQRTVSQRSLTVPTIFQSDLLTFTAPYSADISALLVYGANGAIPNVTASIPVNFNNSNVDAERKKINGLVLVAVRTKIRAMVIGSVDGYSNKMSADSLKDWCRTHLGIGLQDTSDSDDPYVATTPLDYFERECPDGFMPLPPMKWEPASRDPKMFIARINATNGSNAGGLGSAIVVTAATGDAKGQLTIIVESLFVNDPKTCGGIQYWPGESTGCSPEHILRGPKSGLSNLVAKITGQKTVSGLYRGATQSPVVL